MNKIFTFIAACAMSLTAMATDYTGQLNVTTVAGSLDPVETTISVTQQEDGNYTFSLKNFSLGTVMNVGTIEVTDIAATTDENGNITLPYEGNVTIQNGDDESIAWGMAGQSVALTMNSVISGNTLTADLSINVFGMTVTVSFEGEAAAASNSKDYTDKLYITVMGNTLDPVDATITITEQENGNYTFTLKNFALAIMGTYMYIGSIELADVEGTSEDGTVTMSTTQTATITEGDDPADATWSYAGQSVDVTMKATMTDDSLYAEMTISILGMNVGVVFGESESTDIKAATISSNNSGVEAIYDMSGRRLNTLTKGLNIIRKADGTTVKVLQK